MDSTTFSSYICLAAKIRGKKEKRFNYEMDISNVLIYIYIENEQHINKLRLENVDRLRSQVTHKYT